MFVFLKRNIGNLNLDAVILPSRQSCLTSKNSEDTLTQEHMPKGVITLHPWAKDSFLPRSSSSLHLQEKWGRLSRSPLKAGQYCPTILKPATHTRRWWHHIPSEVFCGKASNSRKRGNSLTYPINELILLPRTRHKKRGSKPQGRSLLAQDDRTEKSDHPIELKQESYLSSSMAVPCHDN